MGKVGGCDAKGLFGKSELPANVATYDGDTKRRVCVVEKLEHFRHQINFTKRFIVTVSKLAEHSADI